MMLLWLQLWIRKLLVTTHPTVFSIDPRLFQFNYIPELKIYSKKICCVTDPVFFLGGGVNRNQTFIFLPEIQTQMNATYLIISLRVPRRNVQDKELSCG